VTIRVGVIGVGVMGAEHAPGLFQRPEGGDRLDVITVGESSID
jgi:predicted dehydrogenase